MRELKFHEKFGDLLEKNLVLGEWKDSDRKLFVYYMLRTLAKQLGGIQYFYSVSEESEIIDGWIEGLKEYSPHRLLDTVVQILGGNYEYKGNYCPRNPLEFKHYMKAISKSYHERREKDFPAQKPIVDNSPEAQAKRKEAHEKFRLTLKTLSSKLRVSARTGEFL